MSAGVSFLSFASASATSALRSGVISLMAGSICRRRAWKSGAFFISLRSQSSTVVS